MIKEYEDGIPDYRSATERERTADVYNRMGAAPDPVFEERRVFRDLRRAGILEMPGMSLDD